ncbi:hypothetical protein ACIP5N_27735 [Streptomyces sp. NPDC088768]|uniref:phage tail termination protein n=1 Tax=Streptomyces sp. NPDC088768 TaxID=3365894 RepID=UPI00381C5485
MILPDVEALALSALRAALPGVRFVVDVPADWDAASSLVAVHRVGGAAIDPRYVDRALLDVQCFGTNRRAASLLARTVRAALLDACRTQTATDEGSLSGFSEVTGPWCTGPDETGTLTRFIATYQVLARPARKG